MRITSENHILSLIDKLFPKDHASVIMSRGDDCVELYSPAPIALSTDIFIEDHHFRTHYFTPEEIGHKALAVNISDLAAAGAIPLGFSMALLCPQDIDADWLERMLTGMSNLAKSYNMVLTGGDISSAEKLGISITAWGRALTSVEASDILEEKKSPIMADFSHSPASLFQQSFSPLLRRGANLDDIIFLLGPPHLKGTGLGLGNLALREMERDGANSIDKYPDAKKMFLTPTPMVEAGLILSSLSNRKNHEGRLMQFHAMDLSDGLMQDISRLINGIKKERYGATLNFKVTDLNDELINYASAQGLSHASAQELILQMALQGGDEYLLLCASSLNDYSMLKDHLARLPREKSFSTMQLGKVSLDPNVLFNGQDCHKIMDIKSFDHFSL